MKKSLNSDHLKFSNRFNCPSASQGFTLIELMIVVAIIAIILTIGMPVYSEYTIRAKVSEALNVANAAKTAVGATCQENPDLPALNNSNGGYNFSERTKYIESITLSGPCSLFVITVVTRQTGADIDPILTITGTLEEGHVEFTCVSDGPNRHVPRTCRS